MKRADNLKVSFDSVDRHRVDKAAQIQGQSVTDFIKDAVTEKVAQVLVDAAMSDMIAEQLQKFVMAMDGLKEEIRIMEANVGD